MKTVAAQLTKQDNFAGRLYANRNPNICIGFLTLGERSEGVAVKDRLVGRSRYSTHQKQLPVPRSNLGAEVLR